MKLLTRLAPALACALLIALGTGCQNRFLANRYYDFRDTYAVGAGITAEPEGRVKNYLIPSPLSLGLYIEITDWLHLGAITHNGYTAESDLRGTFVGPESTTRFGFLWWQMLRKNEDYENAWYYSPFKNKAFPWCQRMESVSMQTRHRPAKRLHYEHWALARQKGTALLHRGKQYWEYSGVEAAISDPFLTHLGVMLKFGVDVSEFSDFFLGWVGIDYKKDDMTPDEFQTFQDMLAGRYPTEAPMVAPEPSVETLPEPAPEPETQAEVPSSVTDGLRNDVGPGGSVRETPEGVEITFNEAVLFDSGSAVIHPEGKQLLGTLASRIKSDYPGNEIVVIGHTDNVPIGKSRDKWDSNWDLGAGRAISVLNYLIDEQQLEKVRFAAMTYADNKPVGDNSTADGRQQNRRTVLLLKRP